MVTLAICSVAVGATACGSGSAEPEAHAPSPTSHSVSSPPAAQPLRAGERFRNLSLPEPYTPSAPNGGTDDYRCLLMDPHLTKPAFLSGVQFEPQNVKVLHHAVVQLVPPEYAARARAKDAGTPGQGWTCFGDTGLGLRRATWVGAWTPNAMEAVLKQDIGYPVKPGSVLILQVHYNLLATGGHAGETDRSGIRLRLTSGTPATKPLRNLPLQAPIELPCASGESGVLCDRAASIADVTKRFGPEVGRIEQQLLHLCGNGKPVPGNTQHCDYPVTQPMTVYAGFGHMHLLGRSIKVELNPGTKQARTLLDVPTFDFDNQQTHPLPTPVDVKPGDTLRVTCTHDATLRRQLPELSKLPPRYTVWGDGTSDEMCVGWLTVTATK
ncbi:monooxygenase [Flindersiella endophytica]